MGWITANVCVSSVVRFRSRVLSPTPNVERRYKLWTTPHRTIEETFCCALGRVNRYLIYDLSQVVCYFSLTSPSPLLAKRWVVFGFAFFKSSDVICRGARKLWSDHALSAGNNCRPKVILIFSSPFACRHTSLRSQTLCCLPRPVYGDASRAWCTTWVFAFERGFRSRVLSPTPNALKIRKRWITRQPRLTQIHCYVPLAFRTSLSSSSFAFEFSLFRPLST
jgi:hypothetical protein